MNVLSQSVNVYVADSCLTICRNEQNGYTSRFTRKKTTSASIFKLLYTSIIKNIKAILSLVFCHNLEMKTRPGNIVTEGATVNLPQLTTNEITAFSLED